MRLVRVTGAALVGMAVLAGCSDGGQASETLPSASSSAAETSESLPALGPPDMPMPPEARQQTEAGVEAFTEYYVALVNRLQNDLDSSYLRAFSVDCEGCERIADDADTDAAAGRTYEGGTLTLTSRGTAALNDGAGEIAFMVDQAPMKVVDATGVPVPDLVFPAKAGLPGGLSTIWQKDHWVVSALSFG